MSAGHSPTPAVAPLHIRWVIAQQPAHLEVEDGAYAGIPCWRGEQGWAEGEVRQAYQDEYQRIRPHLLDKNGVGGVSLHSVLAVAREMARAADWTTGRESRLAVATLCDRTGLGERTVQTARRALKLLGLGTEVLRGRQRTKNERLISHKAGDRSRGWASEWALHPRKPVDKTRIRTGNTWVMAPHPRRGVFYAPSLAFSNSLPTRKTVENRPAPRGKDSRRVVRRSSRRNTEAVLLAARWLREPRTPRWALPHPVHRWAQALTPAAKHGFTAEDLNDLIDQWCERTGRAAQPHTPLAWMKALLAKTDLDFPPHVLKQAERDQRAREAAESYATQRATHDKGYRDREAGKRMVGCDGYLAAKEWAKVAAQAGTHR